VSEPFAGCYAGGVPLRDVEAAAGRTAGADGGGSGAGRALGAALDAVVVYVYEVLACAGAAGAVFSRRLQAPM